MEKSNDSSEYGFILVGFSDRPKLEMVLFIVNFTLYSVAVLGNSAIILVCILDSRLHTPMYFFLANLSCLEVCYTSNIMPRLLVDLLRENRVISMVGCIIQLYFFGALSSTECYLLAVMSYDQYLAVCWPLHYPTLMHGTMCLRLVTGSQVASQCQLHSRLLWYPA